jgi:hypothetical protein
VLFVAVIAGLLLVNELPVFRRLGPVVVYALYSFCLTSYFAYLYPVLIGRLRWWMFVLAVATALAPLLLLGRVHLRVTGDRRRVFRHALLPSLGTQAALLALFLLRWLPPVPLSLMEIGIYHGVTRDASGSYQLSRQAAPWWKPWAIDDTDFTARAGDRVYCFFRVFAPVRFEDDVRVRWSYRDPGRGWLPSDAVPIAVRGGRERGFTGYAYKQNWRPGQWRVAVETADGREIGRRDFSVREDGPSQTVQRSRTRGRIAPDNCAHGSFSGGRRHERFEHPGCSRARVRVGDAFPGRRAGHGMRSRLPDEHCRFVSGRARRSRCLEGSDGREREVHGAGESPQGRRGRPLEKRDLDVDHVQDSGR